MKRFFQNSSSMRINKLYKLILDMIIFIFTDLLGIHPRIKKKKKKFVEQVFVSLNTPCSQDPGSKVWVGLNWPCPSWARLSWDWLPVYSCSPPRFGEGFTPCMWSVWSSGAAVPPTAHTCTLPHHPPRRLENRKIPENGSWELGARCGQTERLSAGIGRAGEEGPEHSHIKSLRDRSASRFLFFEHFAAH